MAATPAPAEVPGTRPDHAAYRAIIFDAHGTVRATEVIAAATDDEAEAIVKVLANAFGIDLWEGPRFVASYPSLEAPCPLA